MEAAAAHTAEVLDLQAPTSLAGTSRSASPTPVLFSYDSAQLLFLRGTPPSSPLPPVHSRQRSPSSPIQTPPRSPSPPVHSLPCSSSPLVHSLPRSPSPPVHSLPRSPSPPVYSPPRSPSPSVHSPPRSPSLPVHSPPRSPSPPVHSPPRSPSPPVHSPPRSPSPPVHSPPRSPSPPVRIPPRSSSPAVATPPRSPSPPVPTPPRSSSPPVPTPLRSSSPPVHSPPQLPSLPVQILPPLPPLIGNTTEPLPPLTGSTAEPLPPLAESTAEPLPLLTGSTAELQPSEMMNSIESAATSLFPTGAHGPRIEQPPVSEKVIDPDLDGESRPTHVVRAVSLCSNPYLISSNSFERSGHGAPAVQTAGFGVSGPTALAEDCAELPQVVAESAELTLPVLDRGTEASDEDSGVLFRILRASMRRMRRFGLSPQGLRRRSSVSQQPAAEAAAAASPCSSSCAGADAERGMVGLASISGAQTQAVFMSTLMDRLNGGVAARDSATTSFSATSCDVSGAGGDVIQVSTRELRFNGSETPSDDASVAFDTPPPPMPVRADGAGAGRRSGRPSLLSRGSSFLGVYQAVPELSSAEESRRAERGYWQHRYSAALVCLSCTLGYGSVCRFALFGGVYGVAFLVQFLVLSLVVGLPLLTLNMTLGQYIGAGAIDMWNISPIFKGIGLAAVFAEFVLGVYTIVPTAWSFVYLRDSFVSSYNHYKWAECTGNCSGGYLQQLTQTVPAYFNSRVLHRNMSETGRPDVGYLGFEISFNLAVIWILIYICLGRGLRSYGKIVYISTILSIISFVIVCIQLLSWTEGLGEFFTDKVLFDNVFWNTVPWVVAARETFMVWGLHGVAVMAAASHCRFSHRLRRDTTLVALVTLIVLFLSALFGFACLRSLRDEQSGYVVSTSSFETAVSSRFLSVPGDGGGVGGGGGGSDSSDGGDLTPPPLEMLHYSNLVSGVIVRNTRDPRQDDWTSGYQVHRLATELFPSLLAAVGGSGISSFWALIFYLALILFGLGQQLAIWRAIVEAVISVCPSKLQSWELTVTLIMCLLGFACSLPLMTQIGIHIIFFLDYCIGSLWWLIIINVLQLLALFYVRGSPFASTQVVTILISGNNCMTNWAGPFLSFIWHVILPMALLVLSVVSFRLGGFGGIFSWSADSGYAYWGLWTRQLGSMMMLFPLLLVPVTGLVQAIRHVRSGRGDLFDRIQSLYRPEYSETILGPIGLTVGVSEGDLRNSQHLQPRYTDPPPKYTPPPSYSTATGARLAKMLRQSMRRSVRRLRETLGTGDSSSSVEASVAAISPSAVEAGAVSSPQRRPQGPPPSYTSVLLESLPGALRRSVRRLSVRLGRLPAASVDEDALLARRTAELTEPPSIGARHKRSVSLDQQRCNDWSPDCAVLPAVSGLADSLHVSRSLPRALTPEQVRQLLRSAVGTRRHTTDTVTDGRRTRTRRSGSVTIRSDPVVHRPDGPESLA